MPAEKPVAPLPAITDYNAAVQHPGACFRDPLLRQGCVETDPLGLPRPYTGNFSAVYRVSTPDGRDWAVKCFTRDVPGRQERYQALGRYLHGRSLPFLTDFTYLEEGVCVGGQWYPVVRMRWVEGLPLDVFVTRYADNPVVLDKLARLWVRLAAEMADAGLAHGDLQHGNVLLARARREGKLALKLVDYDGMFVPELASSPPDERGHPNYQHPQRTRKGGYSPAIDRFSHLVICTALRALLAGGRDLHERYGGEERLLFRQQDFTDPRSSRLLAELWSSPAADVRVLTGRLLLDSQGPLDQVSFLPELIRGGPVLPLDGADELRVRACLGLASAQAGVTAPPAAAGSGAEPMRVTLTVTAGPHAGREFTFVGHDTFLVGRSAQAHFQLASKDRYFSRLHFLVEINPPRCALLDLGSRNGTQVNGRKVVSSQLVHGDEIRAGHTILRVGISGVPAAPTTRQPAPSPLPPAPAPQPAASPAGETVLSPQACQNCGAPAAVPVSPGGLRLCAACREAVNQQPQRIPGYRLVRELGRGGMGVVYLAVRNADEQRVALKTIQPASTDDAAAVQRFLRETEILRQLDHPHIIACRGAGEADGLLWFAMDYVDGMDAAALLRREGPLAVGRAVRLVRQALEGLAYAHDRGFVHRDVKPSNLLVGGEEEQEVVRLADFGLARLYQASQLSGLTLAGDVGGTPAYMPPEQITAYRDACPASDQYSAAATLYTLLTDAHVHDFRGDDLAKKFLAILHEDAVPIRRRRADLPEGLAWALHRALDRDPHRRWPHVRDFAEALAPFGP